MSTTTTNGIAEYLQAEVAFLRQHSNHRRIGGYLSLSDFLLQHGRTFSPRLLPDDVRMGRAMACFQNCNQLAIDCSRFTYCATETHGPVLDNWSQGFPIFTAPVERRKP